MKEIMSRFNSSAAGALERRQRLMAVGHLFLVCIYGALIGFATSWLAIFLSSRLEQPWPYLINGGVMLTLKVLAAWIWLFISEPVNKWIMEIGRRVIKMHTGLEVQGELDRYRKIETAGYFYAVMALTIGFSTFVVTSSNTTLESWSSQKVAWTTILIGAVAMTMLSLSHKDTIHALVYGKHWYQRDFAKRQQANGGRLNRAARRRAARGK